MSFPYNDQGQPNTTQAILAGVANVSANGVGFLMVSTVNAGGSLTLNGDATNNRVSAFSQDAGLFRVSTVGSSGTSNDILIDGRNNTVSATLIAQISLLSGIATSARDSLLVRAQSLEADQVRISAFSNDAGLFHVSSFLDSGSVSAKSSDAGLFHVSALVDSGSVSAKSGDASLLRISAIGAPSQTDAGLFHVSAFIDSGSVSAKSSDAGTFHVSSFVDSGSISARSADANQFHVSSVNQDANLMHVSAFNPDAGLFLVSAKSVADSRAGGGFSTFSTSAGIAVISTVKASPGKIQGWALGNPAGVDQYLQVFYTSGGATLGTDVPNLTVYVPTLGGNNIFMADVGLSATGGIQVAITSTAGGNTAGASAMRVNLFYI